MLYKIQYTINQKQKTKLYIKGEEMQLKDFLDFLESELIGYRILKEIQRYEI